ncbi:T9SS type A sorting domain-containing protein [Persicobacter psychrovividus]|uniref:Secretion system C-terminal sorting domain-containing protein n=1 Tax=Persicobacter psychrovividus TaxID=387638 RepID=A0ABM7VLY3_9BACT|nr:hypothetical protein PEPS_42920 [Persicobacter psychrovividus]
MKKKLFLWFTAVLLLLTVRPVTAQNTVWNPAANPNNDGLSESSWHDAANWTAGVPTADGGAIFNVKDAIPCFIDQTVNVKKFVLGDGGTGETARLVVKNGGHLITGNEWSGTAWTAAYETELVVEQGGIIDFGNHFWNGWQGHSSVYLNGGVINVNNMLGTAFEDGTHGSSTILVAAGELNLNEFHPEKTIPEGSVWNITSGTVSIKGDQQDNILNLASLGRIVTTGESGSEDRLLQVELEGEGETLKTVVSSTENEVQPPVVPAETVWAPQANPANTDATEAAWSVAANWTNGLPGEITVVKFTQADAIDCFIDSSVSIKQLILGDGNEGDQTAKLIIKDNGFLSTANDAWSGAAWADNWDTELVVETGGTISFGQHFWNGWQGHSTVYLNGGVINVNNMLGTAFEEGTNGTSTIYLESGEMNLNEFHPENSLPDGSVWNITGAKIYIKGDHKASIEYLEFQGRIITTGEDGTAELSLKVEIIGTEGDPITRISAVEEQTPPTPTVTVWNPAANEDNSEATEASWSVAENWTAGVPTPKMIAKFDQKDAIACFIDQRVGVQQFVLGDGGEGAQSAQLIIKDGGSLTTGDTWSGCAWSNNYTSSLIIEEGGELNFGSHFWNGWQGHSMVHINGGIVNVNHMYATAFEEGTAGTSTTYITDGELNLNVFDAEKSLPEGSVWNITEGVVYIKGDYKEAINQLVTLGRILTTGESGDEDRSLIVDVSGEGDQALTRIATEENGTSPEDPLFADKGKQLVVAPNPTDGIFSINIPQEKVGQTFRIYSIIGRMVMEGSLQNTAEKVNIGHLPSGVYLIHLHEGSKPQISKIVLK